MKKCGLSKELDKTVNVQGGPKVVVITCSVKSGNIKDTSEHGFIKGFLYECESTHKLKP